MNLKRIFFAGAVFASFALVLGNGRWESRLHLSSRTWIIRMERAPVWSGPEPLKYLDFSRQFQSQIDFPEANTPNMKIERALNLERMLIDFFLYIWPILIIFGLLNISKDGSPKDKILFFSFYGGIGLTVGAIACIFLWLIFGGWGPPLPLFFGFTGLIGGFVYGYKKFKHGNLQLS